MYFRMSSKPPRTLGLFPPFLGPFRVLIKGADNKPAVLCTDTHTYDLKKVETSNTVFLVSSPVDKMSGTVVLDSTIPSHLEVLL